MAHAWGFIRYDEKLAIALYNYMPLKIAKICPNI
jgi:hypothetical protein